MGIISRVRLRRLKGQLRATPLARQPGQLYGCLPKPAQRMFKRFRTRPNLMLSASTNFADYEGSGDLEERIWVIFKQIHGSCAAECTTQALQLIREVEGLDRVKLQPLGLYCYSSGGRDRGSNIGTNIKYACRQGTCTMATRPRSDGFRRKLTTGELEEAKQYRLDESDILEVDSKAEFVSSLANQRPICYGRSNHAILAVDWLPGDRVLFANSWGQNWSESGFGIDTWSYISRAIRNYGAYSIGSVLDPSGEADAPAPR